MAEASKFLPRLDIGFENRLSEGRDHTRSCCNRARGSASTQLPIEAALTRRGVAALDHDGLDLAAAVASKGCDGLIFGGFEAGDPLLERWELNHHKAMKLVGSLQDLEAPAPRQHLAAVPGDDGRHAIG